MKYSKQNLWHELIRLGLIRIFYPCLMIFGTIGNILCLKILLRKRFRRQSTCQYLCILAVIDILFIYTRSTRYLYRHIFNTDLRNTSLWVCRSFIFFSSTLSHSASWILVIVSFDRYLIIRNLFPCRHAGWRVIKSTCLLVSIVCFVNGHYFFILGTDMRIRSPNSPTDKNLSNESSASMTRFICLPHPRSRQFFRYFLPIYDLLLVAIIPFLLMIFTNIGILRTAVRSNLLRITTRRQKRNNRLTLMLLTVILAFMLLTCPSVIYICLNRLNASNRFSDTKIVILELLESLWYTKHAMNFILYTLSGQDFRREFRKLIYCSKRSRSNSVRNPRQHQRQHKESTLISGSSCGVSDQTLSIRSKTKLYESIRGEIINHGEIWRSLSVNSKTPSSVSFKSTCETSSML